MSSNVQDITGPIIVVAHAIAKPGKEDIVADRIAKIRDHALSDKEPGTLTYRITRFGAKFAIFEQYENADAYKHHVAGPISQVAAEKDELLEVLLQ
ncbi:uncharacterized protein EI90DRAFT_1311837 [Cantharellus anzutake]|uniref:uncharacterized protein n=1 Tax=Cantharellus anzutake TaxID=1750568 RepID=UPI0019081F6E|nr:uncharacterized protein EI90DRAFT_1311837 [Cantharellus anzutake]KAF8342187.1 hypothetical protein EI90DRAFT_1311837 [Cantharellus anzutake]